MTCPNFSAGYTGYRCYGYTTHLRGVWKGDLSPSQHPIPPLVKTSDIYVTYVTPVTDPKFLFLVLGRVLGIDPILNKHGVRSPLVAASGSFEPRRNGPEHPLDILATVACNSMVITMSPRRNIRPPSKSYATNSRMFFCSQFQFCEGDNQ